MSNQETFEQIEAYLNGALTGVELADFETRLKSDQQLADQVLLFQEIDQAVGDQSALHFQQLVKSEGDDFLAKQNTQKNTPKSISLPRRYLAIAATLLVLVVSLLLYWNINTSAFISGKALYAQNFETYNLHKNLRSESTTDNAVFKLAIEQYQARDFNAASTSFQQLATDAPEDQVLAFCLGNAFLNQQPPKLDLAKAQFQKIIDDGESIYVIRAKWFNALILIESEQFKLAESLLEEVATTQDNLGQKAKSLLQKIKQ